MKERHLSIRLSDEEWKRLSTLAEHYGVAYSQVIRMLVTERCRELAYLVPPSGIVLPGWTCPVCKTFNGEEKDKVTRCRGCDGGKVLMGIDTPHPMHALIERSCDLEELDRQLKLKGL